MTQSAGRAAPAGVQVTVGSTERLFKEFGSVGLDEVGRKSAQMGGSLRRIMSFVREAEETEYTCCKVAAY
ncbi:hypothetical protein [Deinococcus sp.]|uniref:hypothetical protein n=1 Tax=Deinococcus sp. TaxID=47478 RepID=UPI003CC6A814